ncbi:MAG: Crp/Fnr family transcriptional regulator [Candidatus Binataceae bacterium]
MAYQGGKRMQPEYPEFRVRLEEILSAQNLPIELARRVEDRLMPVTYEKGAIIFTRGSAADLVFWLVKGFAKLYLPQDDGARTLVDLNRAGDMLSFATTGRHHLLEAHAATKCTVGLFSFDHLLQILGNLDAPMAARLLEGLNTAWSTAFERYITFVGSSFRKRLGMVIDSLGARFGINEKRGILLVPELSHEDLAEMIGSSRPMVSKLIGDMLQEGVLERGERRHFIVRTPLKASVATNHHPSAMQTNGASKLKRFADDRLYPLKGTTE